MADAAASVDRTAMVVETAVPDAREGAIGPLALQTRLAESGVDLAARRRAAWDLVERLPPPSSRSDEDWRRTDFGRLRLEDFIADPGPTDRGASLVDALRDLRDQIAPGAALAASTRRGLRALEDTDMLAAQGVQVLSLDEAARHDPATLARTLDLVAPSGHGADRFLAMWQALWRGGVFVHVPAGVHAAVPVVAGYATAGDHAAILPATVAVLEPHSSLTLIEVYLSPAGSEPMLSDAVSSLVVGEGARLDHCIVQRWGGGAWHVGVHRARLDRDARLRCFSAALGSATQKSYLEVILDGPGAEADISGIVVGEARQHLDTQSAQDHRAPHCRSDLLLKVAVRDRAQSVYGGVIDVHPGAQGTNAYVTNRNLILSPAARASGIPRLEIRADDVRCSHGVTAGHVDPDEAFYLMTRGIPAEDAERIIVRGFLQDALDRCPHPGVSAAVGALLDTVVAGASGAGVPDHAGAPRPPASVVPATLGADEGRP